MEIEGAERRNQELPKSAGKLVPSELRSTLEMLSRKGRSMMASRRRLVGQFWRWTSGVFRSAHDQVKNKAGRGRSGTGARGEPKWIGGTCSAQFASRWSAILKWNDWQDLVEDEAMQRPDDRDWRSAMVGLGQEQFVLALLLPLASRQTLHRKRRSPLPDTSLHRSGFLFETRPVTCKARTYFADGFTKIMSCSKIWRCPLISWNSTFF
ncbi:MAG: hypothetical protein NCA08_05305 [Deltaproteobacteria bacterium]|nr:hypothetical protein [Candidatus Deferrimicrobium borealis]